MISAFRFITFITFWAGVFGIIREWRYSRRHGLAITGAEKLYLLLMLPVIIGMSFLIDLVGVPRDINGPATFVAMCLAVNAWPAIRRVRRA